MRANFLTPTPNNEHRESNGGRELNGSHAIGAGIIVCAYSLMLFLLYKSKRTIEELKEIREAHRKRRIKQKVNSVRNAVIRRRR